MTRRRLLAATAVLAVAVHLVALYLPSAPEAGVGPPGLDKVAHVLLFAVPVWLIGALTGRVWLVAAVFAGHAVVSELVQHWFLPHRDGDPFDLLADLVGIAAAVALLATRRDPAGPPEALRHPPDAPSR
ncbi:MAG: VanZ family protein [Propionicimonas sp.]|nr:VanZ family protein [Propionicimonas sp.]